MEKISTSNLAKQLEKNSKELFKILADCKLIFRKNDAWHLTSQGKEFGGEVI